MSSAFAVAPNIESLLDEIQARFRVEEPFHTKPRSHTSTGSLLVVRRSNERVRLTPRVTPPVSHAKILIVDDEPINVKVCQKYLRELGYVKTSSETDSTLAMEKILAERPDLIVLDVMMPVVSGIDLLKLIRAHSELSQIPVLILTASCERNTRLAVLEAGASDFLTKPIDPCELAPRIRNALTIKRQHDHLRNYTQKLEEAVRVRTADLETSRLDVIHCLARAVEYRDDYTGRHVERVGRYSGIIARGMGLDEEFCRNIALAAQLHDIGKIGVPDEVLLKPGRLTSDEYQLVQKHVAAGKRILEPTSGRDAEQVQQHVQIGSCILNMSKSPLLAMASRIALTHHEKWDGTGYPLGLAGEDIPLEGRITAVADVFDALSSRRPYKAAFPLDKCFEIMEQERGAHFAPQTVDAFFAQREAIVAAQMELADPQ